MIYAKGQLNAEVGMYLAQQFAWIVVLWAAAAVVWTRGIARYASQGG
jgi:ABC-type uncharacterized transport system permease subunit